MKSDFPSLLKRLNDGGVEYVVVGGIAAAFHGADLSNIDCDLSVGMESENLGRLATALRPFDPVVWNYPDPEKDFHIEKLADGDGAEAASEYRQVVATVPGVNRPVLVEAFVVDEESQGMEFVRPFRQDV